VIALTSPYLWYTSRATGLVALVLITSVVVLGTLVSNRVGGKKIGRFEFNELHRSLSLVAMTFLLLHIVTTVIDTYAPTGWLSALVPFVSRYDRVGVAVGAVAIDLMIAVWASSLFKSRVQPQTWRYLHWLSWLAYVGAIAHTLLIGADTRNAAASLSPPRAPPPSSSRLSGARSPARSEPIAAPPSRPSLPRLPRARRRAAHDE
jgi:sulfoxide reductase heme-binding subunit YedZ